MITYLVDTDWAIDYLKGKPKITNIMSELYDEGLAISIISLAELYEGVYGSKQPNKQLDGLNRFLQGITVVGINNSIVKIFGKQRFLLRKQGKLIDNFDLMIASTCLYYNLTLLTNNVTHFKRIPDLNIITI